MTRHSYSKGATSLQQALQMACDAWEPQEKLDLQYVMAGRGNSCSPIALYLRSHNRWFYTWFDEKPLLHQVTCDG